MPTLMYTRFLIAAALLLTTAFAYAQTTRQLVLTNPLDIDRPDELIVLSKKMLEQKLGKIPDSKFVVFNNKANRPLVAQFDDLDRDGKWDEVALLLTFKPKEKIAITISLSDRPAAIKAVVMAHVRLRKKYADDTWGPLLTSETMPLRNPATDFSKQPLPLYLTEGPAWENDKVAFRLYMDMRNGRDIFGKRVTHMITDSVGVVAKPSYHDLHDWGMDVLHAGKSLGAGAIAIQVKINGIDTLVRLGGADISKTVFELVSDGPVRGIFRMKYNWTINGSPVQITDETSIWGGQYFYESKITVTGVPAGARLVQGIANFNENTSSEFQENGAAVLYSNGKQSENKDELGMAIMVNNSNYAAVGKTPFAGSDILDTYIISQFIRSGPLVSRFYAGWVKTDSRFANADYFINFLRQEALKKDKPVSIY